MLAKFCREIANGRALSPLSAASDDRRVEDNAPYLLLPHFIGASTGSTDLRRTLRRLCLELAKAASKTEPLPLDIKELITHFQKLLAEAAHKSGPLSPMSGSDQTAQRTERTTGRIILVFDALNQFDATDGAHCLNWLPRELPPGVRIVASVIAPADGQPEHQTLAILRHRPGTRIVKLEPLTESDTLSIIEGYLKRYSKRLSEEQIAALKEKPASSLPLYVLTALRGLSLDSDRSKPPTAFGKGIADEQEATFRVRAFEEHGPSFERYLKDPLTKGHGAYLTDLQRAHGGIHHAATGSTLRLDEDQA